MCDPHCLEEVEQGIVGGLCWVAGTILSLGGGRGLGRHRSLQLLNAALYVLSGLRV